MAFTRYKYDDCRTRKELQESTGQGRYVLNTPGWGASPSYIEDPQIRIQGWAGNLMTNSINLESELLGVNRQLNKDCLGKNEYKAYNEPSKPIQYPNNTSLTTGQSRTTNPAWTYRDLEQVDWYYPPFQPQENTCMPFQSNLSTRILEKDYYNQEYACIPPTQNGPLPVMESKNKYVGGTNICTTSNTCLKL